MFRRQILSRRDSARKVDFRPDADPESPFAQLRRLEVYLDRKNPGADDITDCTQAIGAYREYLYRKLFTSATHEEYLALDAESPETIDWLIATGEVADAHYRRSNEKRGN